MNQFPEKSRLEILLETAKPISDAINYSIDTSERLISRVGNICNGLYYHWLFNPRTSEEFRQDMELENVEFDKRISDYNTGLGVVAVVATSSLIVIGIK